MKPKHTVLALLVMIGIALIVAPAVAGVFAPVLPERVVLENGLTVILAPIAGSGQAAVTSLYRAGLTDEPEGMPMVSYLTARAVFSGATKSYKAGEAIELLFRNGLAGGETMPCLTHCDYVVPSDDLELALKIEGERLTSLRITQELVDNELALCYDEVIALEKIPETGLFKQACSALGQAWRYRAAEVAVKSGLEAVPLTKIQEYHASRYQPSGAVVVLAGDFDRTKALDLVKKHLGSIPSQEVVPAQPIEWDNLPNSIDVKWDSDIRALCIAFRPTGSAADRLVLQMLGGLLSAQLSMDEQIAGLADCVVCADPVQTLNSLPFFIYATPKQGVSIEDLRKALESALQEEIASPEVSDAVAQLVAMAQQMADTPIPSNDELVAAAKQMLPGCDPEEVIGLMIGQVALGYGFEEMITGGSPDYLSIPVDTPPDVVFTRLKAMLDPSNEFVTVLQKPASQQNASSERPGIIRHMGILGHRASRMGAPGGAIRPLGMPCLSASERMMGSAGLTGR